MAELIFSALRILGAMWMVSTFIVVVGSFVRLVGEGKDLVGVLFGSIFLSANFPSRTPVNESSLSR